MSSNDKETNMSSKRKSISSKNTLAPGELRKHATLKKKKRTPTFAAKVQSSRDVRADEPIVMMPTPHVPQSNEAEIRNGDNEWEEELHRYDEEDDETEANDQIFRDPLPQLKRDKVVRAIPTVECLKTEDGKFILRVVGHCWIPTKPGVKILGKSIKSAYREPWCTWCSVPQEVRDRWWSFFREHCTWDPRDDETMRKNWHERGGKRLGGILKKARDKRTENGKPKWMRDAAWKELTDYWDSPEFLAKSAQAKANQASKKGGALHTTGPISHVEVAENMASELNRPVDPDELVCFTRRHKDGSWIDDRSKEIYTNYQEAIREISSQASVDDIQSQDVDPLKKLQTWSDTVGGKNHNRVWGTAGLSSSFSRAGASIAFYTSQNAKLGACDASNKEWKKEMEEKHEVQGDKIERQEEELAYLRTTLKAVLQRLAVVEGSSALPSSTPVTHPHYNDECDEDELSD